MPKVRGRVPNVINGISQQAPSLRLTSQSSLDLNTYPLIVDGLVKRPPTQHLAKLGASISSNAFAHHILRDNVERYSVTIDGSGTIRVYDFAGNAKTVNDNSGGNYFNGVTSPKDDLCAMTIGDTTFIINKKKVVAASSSTVAARPSEGVVWVRQGNYGHDYKIFIDGVQRAIETTPDGSAAAHSLDIRTNLIADNLRADLVGAGYNTGSWATTRYANTLHIQNTAGDFSLSAEDSAGDTGIVAMKDKVSDLGDLPPHNKHGFKIRVSGSDDEEIDDYWVEFVWEGLYSSRGTYEETVAPGAKVGLDAATMPHILVRESDGTFTFEEAPWAGREVGDDTTNPDPSFVGSTLNDITFHRNRLGFITEDNIVLSRNGDFYNFYRTTMTALLDTDPIDIAPSHTKVSLLQHAVPHQDELMLFSEETQFRVAGNELLTPKTAASRPISEISAYPGVRPITVGSALFFIQEGVYFAHLNEYYYDKSIDQAQNDDVSSHAPNFIRAGVTHLTGTSDIDVLAIASAGSPNSIYLYKYYVANREKLQSAWVEWQIAGVTRIAAMDFDGTELYLTLLRADGSFYVEKIECEEGQGEVVHLDRRYPFLTGSYNTTSGQTSWALPYDAESETRVVTGTPTLGIELPIASRVGSIVYVDGDYSSTPVLIGSPYESRHQFSQFFYRQGSDDIVVTDGRLQVLSLTIQFSNTSFFQVVVDAENRTPKTYPYTGMKAGDEDTITGEIVVTDDHMTVPIRSRNDRVVVDIVNDTWRPMAINSATWRGFFNPLSRER